MNGVLWAGYFFSILAVVSAIFILFVKNIFHAVLALLACVLSVAALFVLSRAEFPGVAQIILYGGGVVVLAIFGVMLTQKSGNQQGRIAQTNLLSGFLAGGGLFFLLVYFAPRSLWTSHTSNTAPDNTLPPIGEALMTDYALPFELAGVLLLVVLVGAAVLAGARFPNPKA